MATYITAVASKVRQIESYAKHKLANKYSKWLWLIITLLLFVNPTNNQPILAAYCGETPVDDSYLPAAYYTYFADEFNCEQRLDYWQVQAPMSPASYSPPASGYIIVDDGSLAVGVPGQDHAFPFLFLVDDAATTYDVPYTTNRIDWLPNDGDFRIAMRVRFNVEALGEHRIAIYADGHTPAYAGPLFYIGSDYNDQEEAWRGLVIGADRGNSFVDLGEHGYPDPFTDWVVLTIDYHYSSDTFTMAVDGTPYLTQALSNFKGVPNVATRPDILYIGSLAILENPTTWTDIELDWLRVYAPDTTPPAQPGVDSAIVETPPIPNDFPTSYSAMLPSGPFHNTPYWSEDFDQTGDAAAMPTYWELLHNQDPQHSWTEVVESAAHIRNDNQATGVPVWGIFDDLLPLTILSNQPSGPGKISPADYLEQRGGSPFWPRPQPEPKSASAYPRTNWRPNDGNIRYAWRALQTANGYGVEVSNGGHVPYFTGAMFYTLIDTTANNGAGQFIFPGCQEQYFWQLHKLPQYTLPYDFWTSVNVDYINGTVHVYIDGQEIGWWPESDCSLNWFLKGENATTPDLLFFGNPAVGPAGAWSEVSVDWFATFPGLPPAAPPAQIGETTVSTSTITIPAYDVITESAYTSTYNMSYDRLLNVPGTISNRTLTLITLENNYLELTLLPELGGRIYQAIYKPTGNNLFYQNPVLKPSPWGPLEMGWWLAAGGMEWGLPVQEHGYEWGIPWQYEIEDTTSGVQVTLKDTTASDRIRSRVVVALPDNSAAFKVTPTIENPTAAAIDYQFWLNAMLAPGPANAPTENLRIIMPTDAVTVHSTNDPRLPGEWQAAGWPVHNSVDWSKLGNWAQWYGFFQRPQAAGNFQAIYDEGFDEGVVRTYDSSQAWGAKFFAFGWGADAIAPDNYTDDGSAYVEIHGGAGRTFHDDDRRRLEPGTSLTWEESWYPVAGLGSLTWANDKAALYLEENGDDLQLHVALTAPQTDVRVLLLRRNDNLILTDTSLPLLNPDQPFHAPTVSGSGLEPEEVAVLVYAGAELLVSYQFEGETVGMLQLTPPQNIFVIYDDDGPFPATAAPQISTSHTTPVQWSASLSPTVSWLSLPASTGTVSPGTPTGLTLKPSQPSTYGTHQTTLIISGETELGSPLAPVSTDIIIDYRPYRLLLTPSTLSFVTDDHFPPMPTTHNLQLSTNSPGPFTWTLALSPPVSWLTPGATSGLIDNSVNTTISLTANRPLTYGLYTTNAIISATNAAETHIGPTNAKIQINYLPEFSRIYLPIITKN